MRFWTGKGLRQRCPLSPGLFTILLADKDEVFGRGWGGVKVGKRKVHTLGYADDFAILAKDEERMKVMLERLKEYLNKKGLELNVWETKVMRCRRGEGDKSRLVESGGEKKLRR